MKTSTKIAFAAALMGILGVGTIVKTVNASPSQNTTNVAQVSNDKGNDASVAPKNMQIGVKAEKSDGDGETNDDANKQQEDAKLQSLAKITSQQAKTAAETSTGAAASSVKLENENGNLVYAVVIGKQEVKVDAGNGKVLYTDNGSENETNEASRPKSSIQVPQS